MALPTACDPSRAGEAGGFRPRDWVPLKVGADSGVDWTFVLLLWGYAVPRGLHLAETKNDGRPLQFPLQCRIPLIH